MTENPKSKERKILAKLLVTKYYKCPNCTYVNTDEHVVEIHFCRWHTNYKCTFEYRDENGDVVKDLLGCAINQ